MRSSPSSRCRAQVGPLSLAFAMIVLILAFGSVLAMGLPVGIALAGIGVGTILAGFLSHVLSIPDFATTIAVMLGLGVGIDYALFIVTRFREKSAQGSLDRGGKSGCARYRRPGRRVLRHHRRHLTPRHGPDGPGVRDGLAAASATVVAVTAVASLTPAPRLLGFAAHGSN